MIKTIKTNEYKIELHKLNSKNKIIIISPNDTFKMFFEFKKETLKEELEKASLFFNNIEQEYKEILNFFRDYTKLS